MKVQELFEAVDRSKTAVLFSLSTKWLTDDGDKETDKFTILVQCEKHDVAAAFVKAVGATTDWKQKLGVYFSGMTSPRPNSRKEKESFTATGKVALASEDDSADDTMDLKEFLSDCKVVKFNPATVVKKVVKPKWKPTFKKNTNYESWHDDNAGRYSEDEIDGELIGIMEDRTGVIGLWYNKAKFGTISKDFMKWVKEAGLEDDELQIIYAEQDPNYPY